MRKIVLYEFTVSGGLRRPGKVEAEEALLREGRAMLMALAADFAAMGDVQPVVLRDCRWQELTFKGCEVLDVRSAADEKLLLQELSREATATIVIAPEFDEILYSRCRWVEDAGGTLLGPSSHLVALAADKQETAQWLAARGVPAPLGMVLHPGAGLPCDFHYPAVLKPVDGCGSHNLQLVESPSQRCLTTVSDGPSNARWRLEEFIPGLAVSVAVLCGPTELRPLAACHQRLSQDGQFRYLGGSLPLPKPLAIRAVNLALRAVATLPEPRGYIGVDLVLGDDPSGRGDVVIEINPRLTTSYIGLRSASRSNLAEAMWAIAEGRLAEVVFGEQSVEFDSDGTVRESNLAFAAAQGCGDANEPSSTPVA